MKLWFWAILYAGLTFVNGRSARLDHYLPGAVTAWVCVGLSFIGFLYWSWVATHRKKVTS